MKLKLNTDVKSFDFKGQNIQVLQYLPAQDKYDLIITDMWYPRRSGGPEEDCGIELAATVKEKGYGIPVIICSNQQYRSEDTIGEVLYGDDRDWARDLLDLVKVILNDG